MLQHYNLYWFPIKIFEICICLNNNYKNNHTHVYIWFEHIHFIYSKKNLNVQDYH